MPDKKDLIRIGQLSKATGVSGPTIKHYVKEGLLPKPVKTSRNMAYYDKSCIKKIQMIKQVQQKQFLPLNVIKGMIDSGEIRDEEAGFNQALSTSHRAYEDKITVRAADMEKKTGLSFEKIAVLESVGLITPLTRDGEKYFSGVDVKVAELAKKRDDLNIPFDFAVDVLGIYKNAISEAVAADIRYFAEHTTGDDSFQAIVEHMAEIEETLDEFIVLQKYKMLRQITNGAIEEMNQMEQALDVLQLFPVSGNYLPDTVPEDPYEEGVFLLCRGRFADLEKMAPGKAPRERRTALVMLTALGSILGGNTERGMETLKTYVPRPGGWDLGNTLGAIAHLFLIGRDSGYALSMFHVKNVLAYLKRIESTPFENTWFSVFARYICGAVYVITPEVMGKIPSGITILSDLLTFIESRQVIKTDLPGWFDQVVDFELVPKLDMRINYFLARGHIRAGQEARALEYLDRVIEAADPDDRVSQWARMKKITIGKD